MTRIPYWNIEAGYLIDILAAPVLIIMGYGLYRHWKNIRRGRDPLKLPPLALIWKEQPARIRNFLLGGLAGSRLYRKLPTGLAHGLVFWGLLLLATGTTLVLLNVLVGLPVFSGTFGAYFMSFTLDVAGLAVLLGVCFLLAKRLTKPARLYLPKARPNFILVEILLLAIILSGFLVEGLRIGARGYDPGSVVGNLVASLLGALSPASALSWHQGLWWIHGLLALSLIAYAPFSPLIHLVLAPVNSMLADPRPGVNMGVMDFESFEDSDVEEMPSLGAGMVKQFSQKRLLDFSTCLWCGRCQEACPANQTGKSLTPKGVVVTLAEYLNSGRFSDETLIDSVGREAVFQCLTCAACMAACPAFLNPPKTIMHLRQNLVMERSELPATMAQARRSLENRRHPFFGTSFSNKDWSKNLTVPYFHAGKTEYLLWVGCATIYEERAQKIARALVNLLNLAGVNYGVLKEPRCTGDPAKQMGDEFLFRQIADENVAYFNKLGVANIITMCPHCFNSFTNHYSLIGGQYRVIPHAVLLADLLLEGKIKTKTKGEPIVFHDSCYLGRRNNIFDEPRQVISSVGRLVEFPNHRTSSFCCGGGGANYWSEEVGTRVNQVRAEEGLKTGAAKIATSCPFCLLMLTDGLKRFSEEKIVFDLAELVNDNLES